MAPAGLEPVTGRAGAASTGERCCSCRRNGRPPGFSGRRVL